MATALTGPWKPSEKFCFIRSHLGHLQLPASTSEPAPIPSLCTLQTPHQMNQSHLTGKGHPEFLNGTCVGYNVPGKCSHAEGMLEEVASPGPPHWCIPLAPSDLRPRTQPGLVTKSPRTASQLPPMPSSAATTQGFSPRDSASPNPLLSTPVLLQWVTNTSQTCTHTWSTQCKKHHGAHSTPAVSALCSWSSQVGGRLGVWGEGRRRTLAPLAPLLPRSYIRVQYNISIKKKEKEGLIALKSLKSTI